MIKTHPRTFRNDAVLQAMLQMRNYGWSLKELAFVFHCDHTSIRKACLRNNVAAEVPILPRPIIQFKYIVVLDGERINGGKSYREYLKEENLRHKAIS